MVMTGRSVHLHVTICNWQQPAKTQYWCGFKFFSCYIYATEELCNKGTPYKGYAERHWQILYARKFQAANIYRFGDMVYNVLPK